MASDVARVGMAYASFMLGRCAFSRRRHWPIAAVYLKRQSVAHVD